MNHRDKLSAQRGLRGIGHSLLWPVALAVALSSGTALAKNGADDPIGDDRNQTQPEPGDDKGGANAGLPTPGTGTASTPVTTPAKGRFKLDIGDDATDPVSSSFTYRADKNGARFKGSLKLQLPATDTGIIDRATAEDALITATLYTGGNPYAECVFTLDRIKQGVNGPSAQFAFTVKTGKGSRSVRQPKGSCDTDLNTIGIQPGIPSIASQDEVVVEFHFDPAPATGPAVFELGRGQF
jgi:hypothetical protein